jgi:hypothetical protein
MVNDDAQDDYWRHTSRCAYDVVRNRTIDG